MADILFKKKQTKELLNATVEWEVNGETIESNLVVTLSDLLKARGITEEYTFDKQVDYMKNTFFKLDFDVDEEQLINQFAEVMAYLKEVIEKKQPSSL